jgi:hypothetical protein
LREKLNAALKKTWQEWEIPREADAQWPDAAKKLHADWWQARIARQQEIDKSIAAKAEFEYLYDKPYDDKKKVRVAGPFTVESLSPHRVLGVDENDELIGITSLGELATATGNRQLAGETLERVSDSAEVPPDREQDLSDAEEETSMGDGALAAETRVTGLFDDSDQARDAVEELKNAGFADYRIAVAMQDRADQDSFIAETKVLTAAVQEIPSLPELDSGQVLLLIDAADQAALALEIINRNQGVTGGVRMPT